MSCTSRVLHTPGGHHHAERGTEKKAAGRRQAGPIRFIEWKPPAVPGWSHDPVKRRRGNQPKSLVHTLPHPHLTRSPPHLPLLKFQFSLVIHSAQQKQPPPTPNPSLSESEATLSHQCVLSSFLFSSSALLPLSFFLYVLSRISSAPSISNSNYIARWHQRYQKGRTGCGS